MQRGKARGECFGTCTHLIPKWPKFFYSFVFMLIALDTLLQAKISLNSAKAVEARRAN